MRTVSMLRSIGSILVFTLAIAAAPLFASALTSTSVVTMATQTNSTCTTMSQTASAVIPPYDVFANAATNDAATSASQFSVICTKESGTKPWVTVSAGNNASGSQRRLSDGKSHFLSYNICQNATCTATGDPVTPTSQVLLTFPGANGVSSTATWSLFPVVLKSQNQPAGTYTDSVNVVVNY
jgi:spore coat protein U-like protein